VTISLSEVERARTITSVHLHKTPMLTSRTLSERIGASTYLKAENFQRTGSFKPRGALFAVASLTPAQRAKGIVTMSVGNAAAAIAYAAYIRDTSIPGRFVGQFEPLYRFLYNKWYFDELYHALFVRPAFWFGRLFWKRGDEGTIDRFGPNGFAWLVQQGSRGAVRLQSGYLNSYALVMLVGLVGAVTWVIAR